MRAEAASSSVRGKPSLPSLFEALLPDPNKLLKKRDIVRSDGGEHWGRGGKSYMVVASRRKDGGRNSEGAPAQGCGGKER